MKSTIAIAVIAASLCAAPISSLAQSRPWTGFYVGGNIGYGWERADTEIATSGSNVSFPFIASILNPNLTALSTDHQQRTNGIFGGGQIGLNYQFTPSWLVGIETDLQASNISGNAISADTLDGTVCSVADIAPPNCVGTTRLLGTASIETSARVNWFGTVRARGGWMSSNQTLIFATGGIAYGRVQAVSKYTGTAHLEFDPNLFRFSGTNRFSESATRIGFALGGGVEGRFEAQSSSNWTWKIEYLYVDFGSIDVAAPVSMVSTGSRCVWLDQL